RRVTRICRLVAWSSTMRILAMPTSPPAGVDRLGAPGRRLAVRGRRAWWPCPPPLTGCGVTARDAEVAAGSCGLRDEKGGPPFCGGCREPHHAWRGLLGGKRPPRSAPDGPGRLLRRDENIS